MEHKARFRTFVLPALLLILSIGNYARLTGNEAVRPVQMLSLIVIGVFLGILLKSLFDRFR